MQSWREKVVVVSEMHVPTGISSVCVQELFAHAMSHTHSHQSWVAGHVPGTNQSLFHPKDPGPNKMPKAHVKEESKLVVEGRFSHNVVRRRARARVAPARAPRGVRKGEK